jgi:hypothetical protein
MSAIADEFAPRRTDREVVGFDLPPAGEYACGIAFLPNLSDQHPDVLSFWLPRSCMLGRAIARLKSQGIYDDTLIVHVPDALGEEQARMEVDLYLKAWEASHPDVDAHFFDSPRSRVVDESSATD